MDTSKEYIKMCEEAKKYINKKEKLWDWYYDKESKTVEVIGSLNTKHSMGNNYHKDEIPLYRQDQLQEMIGDKPAYSHAWGCAIGFSRFINTKFYSIDYSMEQLWLAFVMHEKYNKVWDNENWIENE